VCNLQWFCFDIARKPLYIIKQFGLPVCRVQSKFNCWGFCLRLTFGCLALARSANFTCIYMGIFMSHSLSIWRKSFSTFISILPSFLLRTLFFCRRCVVSQSKSQVQLTFNWGRNQWRWRNYATECAAGKLPLFSASSCRFLVCAI